MKSILGWSYPDDLSDQWDGFNDSGIEHFRGSPIPHLAREIAQNSLDAVADEVSEPVVVTFRVLKVPVESIPNHEELLATIEACSVAAKQESDKAELFFAGAKNCLSEKNINILQIEDFNTRGVVGPCENGYPYYAFMKATGQSKKQNDTAGGSYGIGKFAPYVVSSLRTVFVSTVYKTSDDFEQLTQAKSVLMSHEVNGARRRGVGFWGLKNKCQPLSGINNSLPHWMQRANSISDLSNAVGTKISILGAILPKGWRDLLAATVAENFFSAIVNHKLVVKIEDTYTLDASSVSSFLSGSQFLSAVSTEKDEPEKFNNCKSYLDTYLQASEVIVEETENRELGRCQLRIWVDEGLPKKVCVLRNGMFITDQLDRLKRFSDFKEFVAVVECLSTKGSSLLRAMEPPRHDDFEPARLPIEDQPRGKKALSDLAVWVREMLKRHAKNPVSEISTIDELDEFFGHENDDKKGNQAKSEINPQGKIILRAKPLSRASRISAEVVGGVDQSTSSIPSGGDVPTSPGRRKAEGDSSGNEEDQHGGGSSGSAATESKVGRPISLNNVRSITKSSSQRVLFFTPNVTGKLMLKVEEAGADSDFSVSILRSSLGAVKDHGVELEVNQGERVSLEIVMSESFVGAIKVVANEI